MIEENELDQEEEFDPEEYDFNIDEDEGDLDEALKEEKKKEKEPEPEEEDLSSRELERIKADYEALKAEKAQVEKERSEAWEETDRIRTDSINGAIQQWQNDLAREQREMLSLQQQHARATADGDVDKIEKLIVQYHDHQQAVNQLNNNINGAHQQLSNKPVRKTAEKEVVKKTPAEEMADKWVSENSWYNDPKYMDKRKLVEKLCADAIANKYDASSLKFWNYIDSKLEESSTKKAAPKRTPPAVRPVSKGGNVQTISSGKKSVDRDILTAVRSALERRGVDKNHPDFDRLQKSYYRTYNIHAKERQSNGN